MSLFAKHHSLSFAPVDPMGDGIGDDIAAEKNEPEAIKLEEDVDGNALTECWQGIVDDVKKDPEWFNFTED